MSNQQRPQHDAWVSGRAADEYFSRNRAKLTAEAEVSRSTQLFAKSLKTGQKVLEIGCANGYRLEQLRSITGCVAYGLDPSPMAIHDGQQRYPQLNLSVGSADRLDFPEGFFDAILLGFCLYLVDRSVLFRVVGEVDRTLSDPGVLFITDFDPPHPTRRAFAHQAGLWSFKMQYPELWLANPTYSLSEKLSFSHFGDAFHPDPIERVASWVLMKQSESAFTA